MCANLLNRPWRTAWCVRCGPGGQTSLAARPGDRITPLRSSLSKRKPILARSLEPCHAEVRVSCPTRRRAMTAVHSERCCVDIGLARHGSPWTRPASRPETAKSQQLSEIGALLAVHFQHHRRFRHHRRSGSNPWRFRPGALPQLRFDRLDQGGRRTFQRPGDPENMEQRNLPLAAFQLGIAGPVDLCQPSQQLLRQRSPITHVSQCGCYGLGQLLGLPRRGLARVQVNSKTHQNRLIDQKTKRPTKS